MQYKKKFTRGCAVLATLTFCTMSLAVDYSEYATMNTDKNDALRIDSNGNLYVSHSGLYSGGQLLGTEVNKVTPDGEVSNHVDSLAGPLGIDFDSDGNFYIANNNGGKITKVTPDGDRSVYSDFNSASAIVINSQNEMFVSSYRGDAVYKVSSTGNKELLVQSSGLNGPQGIALDENGNIYVGNYDNGTIFQIDSNNNMKQLGTVPGGAGYITYSNGIVYATGRATNQIYKVAIEGGEVESLDGSADVGFLFPNGITASEDGSQLYVSNYNSNKIFLIENFDDRVVIPLKATNDSATVELGSEVNISVLSNDTTVNGTIDLASINIVSDAQNGTTTTNDVTGEVTYTPNDGFSGSDAFIYTVKNTDGDTSNEANVTITVIDPNEPPQANDDNATVNQDSSIVINITENDESTGQTLDLSSIDIITLTENGVASINGETGEVTYTPTAGFSGSDSFIYTINNDKGVISNQATVSITITPTPVAPAPTETVTPAKSGGGSFGNYILLMLMVLSFRKLLKARSNK